jgi:Family of unknown function (DUF6282)
MAQAKVHVTVPQVDASVVDRLMAGAVDLHVHSGPSLMPRRLDHVEALREADVAGMAAIVLKDHYYPTMPIATLLNAHLGTKAKAIGSVVLNNPLGDFNVHAVDYALKQDARIVWMPTAHAKNHLDHYKSDQKFDQKFPQSTQKLMEPVALTLTDANGKVVDKVKAILDLIAAADAVVSGGHHHIDELWAFYEEAKARGVRRLLLNHPTYVNEASFQDIARLVRAGVKMEHSVCMFVPSIFTMFDRDHLKQVIDAAGIENTLFGSDLGQVGNPTPVEGFRQMIAILLDLGYSEAQIATMIATNAAQLVGLEPADPDA